MTRAINVSGGSSSSNTATGGGAWIAVSGNQNISISGISITNNTSAGGGPTNSNSFGGGLALITLGVAGFTPTTSVSSVTISGNHADGTTGAAAEGSSQARHIPLRLAVPHKPE